MNWKVVAAAAACAIVCSGCSSQSFGEERMTMTSSTVAIGWAETDITPNRPVSLAGQHHVRIASQAKDPLTATVLFLGSGGDDPASACTVLVSCDLLAICDGLRDGVRKRIRALIPGMDPLSIILNATHTHTAPITSGAIAPQDGQDVMQPPEYVAFATERIAEAIRTAWTRRAPGGVAFGLGQAVVGHNRAASYVGGKSRMYGRLNDPAFRHMEGPADPSLHVLLTYDAESRLTGMVLNLACPSQVTENLNQVSADFWHETRQELRRRFGKALPILAQAGAAGDQVPRPQDPRAENRMLRLAGWDRRQEIAMRIADAVEKLKPLAEKELNPSPVLKRHSEILELPRRRISQQDAEKARAAALKFKEKYEALQNAGADPHRTSRSRALWRRQESIVERYKMQQEQSFLPTEFHVVRLGDVVFATNPFELYLDYGIRIQARSMAIQTFLVQHNGWHGYLATERAVVGGAYGTNYDDGLIGPEGAEVFVDWTVKTINDLFTQ